MATAPSAYDNETYLQALNSARADIQRNVQNAMNEVGRQEQVAVGQTDKIGGAVRSATERATQMHEGGLKSLDQAATRHNLGGLSDITQTQTRNARAENRENQLGTQGSFDRAADLLAQGFREQAVGRRSSVNMIATDLYGQNDRARSDYISRREQEARNAALQREQMAQQARMHREGLAARAREAQLARDQAASTAELQAMRDTLLLPENADKTGLLIAQWARQRGTTLEALANELSAGGIDVQSFFDSGELTRAGSNQPRTQRVTGGGRYLL